MGRGWASTGRQGFGFPAASRRGQVRSGVFQLESPKLHALRTNTRTGLTSDARFTLWCCGGLTDAMAASDEHLDFLRSIDATLGALLALALRDRLHEKAPTHKRSMDKLLRDVGVDVSQIAALLGKTPRAVYLALEEGDGSGSRPKAQKKPRRAKS